MRAPAGEADTPQTFQTTVTAWPPGVNAGSLPVRLVRGAPIRLHKHDPSAAITTGRPLVVSTNAIVRPFRETLG